MTKNIYGRIYVCTVLCYERNKDVGKIRIKNGGKKCVCCMKKMKKRKEPKGRQFCEPYIHISENDKKNNFLWGKINMYRLLHTVPFCVWKMCNPACGS